MNPTLTRRARCANTTLALALLASLALALLSPAPVHAQEGYKVILRHSFAYYVDGAELEAAVTSDGQGHLYGTTAYGGAHGKGTLFEYDANTNVFTTLFSFSGPDGAYPYADVALDGVGHLFGPTYKGGGSKHLGTVFEFDLSTGTITRLVSFNGSNGSHPVAGVTLDGQGHLYGTTDDGGKHDEGTLFKVNIATHTLTTLVNFNYTNGEYPVADLTPDGQGHLYGTTQYGGQSGNGTLFKVNLATNVLTTLHQFQSNEGRELRAAVTLDGQGHLYGTAIQGGGDNDGTLYKFNLTTRALTVLIHFNTLNGAAPAGSVTLDGQGHLYGTTNSSRSYGGSGTVFKYSLATHYLTTIVRFNYHNGRYPIAGITIDSGRLFGTTFGGGDTGDGTLFELVPRS